MDLKFSLRFHLTVRANRFLTPCCPDQGNCNRAQMGIFHLEGFSTSQCIRLYANEHVRLKHVGNRQEKTGTNGLFMASAGVLVWQVLSTFINMNTSTFVEPHISTTFMTIGVLASNQVSSS